MSAGGLSNMMFMVQPLLLRSMPLMVMVLAAAFQDQPFPLAFDEYWR